MTYYNLILTLPKIEIPLTNIIELVKDLIATKFVTIDYFGYELDYPVDYEDEEMIEKRLTTTYINIIFEYNKIEFDDYDNNEIFNLITKLFESNKVFEIKTDNKDIYICI